MKRIFHITVIAVIMAAISFPYKLHAEDSANKKQHIKDATIALIESIYDDTVMTTVPIHEKSNELQTADADHYDYLLEQSQSTENIIIVLIAITTPFLSLIIIVFLALFFSNKKRRLRYHTLELAITNGKDLPASFYENLDNPSTKSMLHSALVWIAWGVGIILFLLCTSDLELATMGSIPLLAGVAKLITYAVENRHKQKKENADEI